MRTRICSLLTALLLLSIASSAQVTHLVISQVYGGGGNSGATYKNDFIEVFNPTNSSISITGYSVQYASAAGTSWQVTNLSGTIPAGGYYLIQEALGAGGTTNLPTPDATGGIAMSATAGKVALVSSTTAIGACPFPASVIDVVAYGSTATCSESAPTPAPSNTLAVFRANNGCTDTDNNASDFLTGAPAPRNSSSPLNICGGCTAPTNQPTALNLTPSLQSVSGSFTGAASGTTNADTYLVLVSTSATLTQQPSSGAVYAIDDVIGNATVVSIDGSTSFTTSNLTPGTNYYFYVYATKGSTNCYNIVSPLTGSIATTTPPACTPPSTGATGLGFSNISGTSATVSYTRGNGDNILVVARSGSSVDAAPTNSVNYPVGTEIGNGNFVVYNGPAASFNYSGLSQNTTYYLALFEYNNTNVCYNPTPLTGSFSTICTSAVNVSSLAGTAGNGQVLVTWSNPTVGCFDEIIVVASTAPITGAGSSYTGTANSSYGGGEQIVYRGTGTNVNVTALTNGTVYYFKVFTRNGASYSSGVQITANPFDPASGFLYLYGNLHGHSSYSDGNKEDHTKTPKEDFEYGRDANCFDFMGMSEHNHSQAGMQIANYHLGYTQANAVNGVVSPNTGNSLVTLWGMEWGVISGGGHVVVYGFDNQLIGWEAGNYDIFCAKNDYHSLWDIVNGQPNSFATLAHPNSSDYTGLASTYYAPGDNAVVGSAVESGPAFATTSTYNAFPSSLSYLSYYKTMLARGYHLGATMDHDNHYFTFGHVNTNRLVVLATEKTRQGITDAMRNMRFYASQDCNARIDYKSGSAVMGSSVTRAGAPSLSLSVTDVDAGETVNTIDIWGGPVGGSTPSAPIKTYSGVAAISFSASDAEDIQPNGSTWYYFTITTQGDGNKIVSSPIWYTRNDAVLPVTFVDFSAQYQKSSHSVKLSWITAQEINSKNFIVERSFDNGRTWTAIGTVAAAGSSASTRLYSFTDLGPQEGKNLYRLQQVDLDGKVQYSRQVQVTIGKGLELTYSLYPNPAHGTAYVTSASSSVANLVIEVVDATGKIVLKKTSLISAAQPYQLPLGGLSSGVYFIKLQSPTEQVTERLIIN